MDDIRTIVNRGGIYMTRNSMSEETALRVYLKDGVESIIDEHVNMVVGDAFKGPIEIVGAQPRVQVYQGKADMIDRDYKVSTGEGDLTVEVSVQIREGDENLLVAFVKVYLSDRDESLGMAQKKYIETLVKNELESY